MPEERMSVPEAVATAIKSLGFGGNASILWTIVMCVALNRSDEAMLEKYWTYLFWTWVILAGIWVVSNIVTAIIFFSKSRQEEPTSGVTPRPADPPTGATETTEPSPPA